MWASRRVQPHCQHFAGMAKKGDFFAGHVVFLSVVQTFRMGMLWAIRKHQPPLVTTV
jgi:hypothetical protein